MKLRLILFLSLFFSTALMAQKTDTKLQKLLEKEVESFRGDIGIYVKNLKTNKVAKINSDSIFSTASIVKVPILVGVFDKIKNNQLQLNQKFIYSEKQIYGGSGLMQFFKDSSETDLSTMVSLMLSYSDNVASLWCQDLAGGGKEINVLMEKLGFVHTKVNSRTEGREANWRKYGWGQTTPEEMARLFILIRQQQLLSPQLDDKMYRYLKNQFYNGRSLSQIPSTVNAIDKTGSVDASRGEVILVNAPSGDYVFCVLTDNNQDKSWGNTNEAEILTKKIANLLWNYFEPKNQFVPFPVIE